MSMLIRAEKLAKTYVTGRRRNEAVREATFDIGEGETTGILGISGSGKSTIGQMVAGLLSADGGHVYYQNRMLRYPLRGADRRSIQIIFQHPEVSFNPRYRLMQAFKEVSRLYRTDMNRAALIRRLKSYGLYEEHLARYPYQLSGGELQRAAIARVVMAEPQLIILDEPTSMLDPISQAQIIDMLRKIQDENKISYLYITHNMQLAELMCSRLYVMEEGILSVRKR